MPSDLDELAIEVDFEGLSGDPDGPTSEAVLAPRTASQTTKEEDDMKTIVLTTDLSDESRRAFGPTLELARKLDHKVVLLHVVQELAAIPYGAPLAPPVVPPDTSGDIEHARKTLTEFQKELDEPVEVEVLAGHDVSQTIVDYAARTDAGFIALSPHGRSGFRRMVMGSVAEQVLRRSKTPVICFPRD